MSNKKPVTTVSNGKRGRPPAVRTIARHWIRETLKTQMVSIGLISPRIPMGRVNADCKYLADAIIDCLREKGDIHLVPGPLCRELALIVGEPLPHDYPRPGDAPINSEP